MPIAEILPPHWTVGCVDVHAKGATATSSWPVLSAEFADMAQRSSQQFASRWRPQRSLVSSQAGLPGKDTPLALCRGDGSGQLERMVRLFASDMRLPIYPQPVPWKLFSKLASTHA